MAGSTTGTTEAVPATDCFSNPVWRSVLDAIPNGLVAVDRRGHLAYCNPFAEMALGISAAEATGQHFRDVFCPSLPLNRCWVSQALDAGSALREHRFQLEHPSGQRYLLIGDLTPVRDREGEVLGAIVAIKQVGDLELADAAELHQDDGNTHEAIVDSIADGLYTVDHEWRITSFNRAAERMAGLREADVVGEVCSQVLETDRCESGCPLAATLERNENLFNTETTLRCTSPHSRAVTVNTAVLRDRCGDPIGGVVSFRDAALLTRLHDDLEPTSHFEGMAGDHPRMLEVYELVAEVADSDASVLIMGESGTGKEMVTNAVVKRSRRRDNPLVKVNCSVFPDALLESELFGHVRGAYTDAREDRVGRFLLADGGTIFLDEIGEISAAAQRKLLRVLEEKQFEPLGTSETTTVDVRIISATNRDLPRLVEEGRFRDDLYYRLNVIPVTLPPLRERRSDIPLLVEYFMAKYRMVTGKAVEDIGESAMELLVDYHYPGNVRELENAIEHGFARTVGNTIVAEKLPLAIRHGSRRSGRNGDSRADTDRNVVLEALERARWNRDRAASILGISRTTLWRRMKALGLDEPSSTA